MLENLDIDVDGIKDGKVRGIILNLLNVIEYLMAEYHKSKQEIQRLRDENNRLKGEQGKPDIKPNKQKQSQDFSSEKERKKADNPLKRKRGTKRDKIKIDRTEKCEVNRDILPPDAIFKGYKTVVIQDVKTVTDNIEFQKEVWYSPSQNKSFMADVPAGYEKEYGPGVKTMALNMKNACNMSEPKILEFLRNKIYISAGTLSNILIKNNGQFHKEKEDIFRAGLESTDYQQADDTSARVNGENHNMRILCNQFYTAFFTTKKKDRLSLLKILLGNRELKYIINTETFSLLKQLRVAKKYIKELKKLEQDKVFKKQEFEALLHEHLKGLKPRPKDRITEAAAIAYYHSLTDYPVVKRLLCDDAPQFKLLTRLLALCWVHEGRHYKKLRPVVPYYAKILADFRSSFWEYYRKLLEYKSDPTEEKAKSLSDEFDELFSTKTGYEQLDDRMAKTKAKKEYLLLVLKYPELPLHNNRSELGARVAVRKRDVSLHTMTEEGTKANDTFLTITETCKKLKVNAYDYIFDRIRGAFKLPSLAEMIKARAMEEWRDPP